MNYIVCSLFDEKTRLFGSLMLFVNIDEAKRYFAFVVNEDKNRLISKDLILYKICDFDSSSGVVLSTAIPEKIINSYEVLGGDSNG